MRSYLNVTDTKFTGHNSYAFFCRRIFYPQQIIRQQSAKPPVNLTDALARKRPSTKTSFINPFLELDVCLGFELKVALMPIFAVIIF